MSGLFRGLLRVPRAFWQSVRICRQFDPDVVIGVGGYSSGPVGARRLADAQAAPPSRSRTRCRVHQPAPLGRFVDAVLIGLPPGGGEVSARKTQPPRQSDPSRLPDNYLQRSPASDRLSIFVTGGSAGCARPQPSGWPKPWRSSLPDRPPLQVLHQTGVKDQPEIAARYAKLESDRPASAGGGVSSTTCRGRMPGRSPGVPAPGVHHHRRADGLQEAAILVPFPFAADDHQTVNAAQMVEGGRGAPCSGKDLTAQKLAGEIRTLEGDRNRPRADVQGERRAGETGGGAGDRRRLRFTLPGTAGQGGAALPPARSEIHPSSAIDYRRFESSTFAVRDLERGTVFRNKKVKVHFGRDRGIGMSGIAELLLNLGLPGERSRPQESRDHQAHSPRWAGSSAPGTGPENVAPTWTVVVTSSAVKKNNPEVIAARTAASGDPRAEMLAELMRLKKGSPSPARTEDDHHLPDRHGGGPRGLRPTAVVGGS